MSRFQSELELKCHRGVPIKDKPFELMAELVYRTDLLLIATHIVVPAGYRTDFASIPRIMWRIIGSPASGKYREAAVIHDWLCDEAFHSVDSDTAADIFNEAMVDLGVSVWRRWMMVKAVKWFGPKFKRSKSFQ